MIKESNMIKASDLKVGEIMMKKEISLLEANPLLEANQYNSSKESRNYLMSLLSAEEQKMFKEFVKSVIGG